MSIIVLYIIYISLTIIKYYVLTCFDKNKITGAFRPKVEHCDFAVGALRLGSRGIATGAFRQWGIATIIRGQRQSSDVTALQIRNIELY